MAELTFASSFEQSTYYTLQEASDYLNAKHNSNNVTATKLLKHIVNCETSTYIHTWIRDESFTIIAEYEPTILKLQSFQDFISTPCEQQDEGERKKWLKMYEDLESATNEILESYFYLGMLLLRVDNNNLFNLSCCGQRSGILISGFNGILKSDDLEADPTQLGFIGEVSGHYVSKINHFDIAIPDIENVDLEGIKKYISLDFDSVYETLGMAYPNFNFNIDDLIIIHKDLLILEQQIIKSAPKPMKGNNEISQQNLPRKRGVSPKKVLAQTLAKHIASEEWAKDKGKTVKILEMSHIVWGKLWNLGFADTLPEQARIKEWIKDEAPSYAREGGRPRQK